MPIPTVSDLPDAPNRNAPGTTFSDQVATFLIALQPFVDELNAFSAALVAAASAANYSATSATSFAVGTGSKAFNIGTDGKLYVVGQYLTIASAADPSNWMYGPITDYTGDVLTIDVEDFTGSGTYTDWQIGLSSPRLLTVSVVETVYTITDGASVNINSNNGGIQVWTLGANRTPTETIAAGASVLLMIADGTGYAVTWTTAGVVWLNGTAPTLPTSGYGVVELWKVGSTLYGAYLGSVA